MEPVIVEQKTCVVDPALLALAEDKLRGRERLSADQQDVLVEEALNMWAEDRGHAANKDRAYSDLVQQIMKNCLSAGNLPPVK